VTKSSEIVADCLCIRKWSPNGEFRRSIRPRVV